MSRPTGPAHSPVRWARCRVTADLTSISCPVPCPIRVPSRATAGWDELDQSPSPALRGEAVMRVDHVETKLAIPFVSHPDGPLNHCRGSLAPTENGSRPRRGRISCHLANVSRPLLPSSSGGPRVDDFSRRPVSTRVNDLAAKITKLIGRISPLRAAQVRAHTALGPIEDPSFNSSPE
jgi:hypothetical protein